MSEGSNRLQDRGNSGTVPPTVKVRTPAPASRILRGERGCHNGPRTVNLCPFALRSKGTFLFEYFVRVFCCLDVGVLFALKVDRFLNSDVVE
jgi:hypothetical protein